MSGADLSDTGKTVNGSSLSVADSEATVEVAAYSGAETLVDFVNGLTAKLEVGKEEEVGVVERIDELKDAGELNATCEPSSSNAADELKDAGLDFSKFESGRDQVVQEEERSEKAEFDATCEMVKERVEVDKEEEVGVVERIDEVNDAGLDCSEKAELNAYCEPSSSKGGDLDGKQVKGSLSVADLEAAVEVAAYSDAETLVESVNGLKARVEVMVERIGELKDAGLDCSEFESDREQGGEEGERSEKASCEPSSSKGGRLRSKFGNSDLVWAKVRSHPWWPGQVFDASMASDKAKKYMKKEKHLIAYFGDQSFAWNETSKIKPFRPNFSQLSKQSNLEDFRDAVDDALDEVSRRVEFGLSCPCVAEHGQIRTQVLVNPGIKDECCRRDGSDRFSSADLFEPVKLVECIKRLGRIGRSGFDRLELVNARAQLLAFNRWKGFSELPELQVLGTVLDEAEAGDQKENVGVIERDDQHGSSVNVKTYSSKRKRDSVEGEQVPAKKEKTLADYIAERRSSNDKGKLGGKKKRKAADSDAGLGFGAKKKKMDGLSTPEGSKNTVSRSNGSFGIGYSILKVASQMNSPSPILKSHYVSSQKSKAKKGSKIKEEKKKKSAIAKPRRKKRTPAKDDSLAGAISGEEEASKVETEMQDEQEGSDEENLSKGNENGEAKTLTDEVVIRDIEQDDDDASVPEQENAEEFLNAEI
ncbi:PWWP domain-containing protein 2 [Linum grandiflorum]